MKDEVGVAFIIRPAHAPSIPVPTPRGILSHLGSRMLRTPPEEIVRTSREKTVTHYNTVIF
jgi:hypothetical protein